MKRACSRVDDIKPQRNLSFYPFSTLSIFICSLNFITIFLFQYTWSIFLSHRRIKLCIPHDLLVQINTLYSNSILTVKWSSVHSRVLSLNSIQPLSQVSSTFTSVPVFKILRLMIIELQFSLNKSVRQANDCYVEVFFGSVQSVASNLGYIQLRYKGQSREYRSTGNAWVHLINDASCIPPECCKSRIEPNYIYKMDVCLYFYHNITIYFSFFFFFLKRGEWLATKSTLPPFHPPMGFTGLKLLK